MPLGVVAAFFGLIATIEPLESESGQDTRRPALMSRIFEVCSDRQSALSARLGSASCLSVRGKPPTVDQTPCKSETLKHIIGVMQVTTRKYFRENLRAYMATRGLSQRDVASAAGVTQPYLSNVLKGKVCPGLDVCDRLAESVGLRFAELIVAPTVFRVDHLRLTPTG